MARYLGKVSSESKCDSATMADCYQMSEVIRKLSFRPKSAPFPAPIVTLARPSPRPAPLHQRSPTKSIQWDRRDRASAFGDAEIASPRLALGKARESTHYVGYRLTKQTSAVEHPMAESGQEEMMSSINVSNSKKRICAVRLCWLQREHRLVVRARLGE